MTLPQPVTYHTQRPAPALVVGASTWRGHADYWCDGINDEAQIQAAADALGSAGGVVQLTPGTYTQATAGTASGSSLNIPYAVKVTEAHGPLIIQGCGPSTVLKLAANVTADTAAIVVRGTSDAARRTAPTVIRDLAVDGNQSNQASSWALSGLLFTAYADEVTIERVYVHDSKFLGIYILRNTKMARILDCHIVNGVNSGLRIETPNAIVRGCWLESQTANSYSNLALVVNNDISVKAEYLSITGNVFEGGSVLLGIGGAQHGVISGNVFRDCLNASGWAIKVEANTANNAEGIVISGNTLYNIRQGILLGPNGSFNTVRCIVQGNSIEEGGGVSLANGIVEGTGANYNLIHGNIIAGASTAITTVGANTVSANNITV